MACWGSGRFVVTLGWRSSVRQALLVVGALCCTSCGTWAPESHRVQSRWHLILSVQFWMNYWIFYVSMYPSEINSNPTVTKKTKGKELVHKKVGSEHWLPIGTVLLLFSPCRVQLFCKPMDCSLPGSSLWDFPGKNAGVGRHFLLQGIFPTQGLNPHILHCRQILYHWAALATLELFRGV